MASVFRVEKDKSFTVMSNHHLRNKDLSLKAKGLLSQMLSLPEEWDYTLAGLAQINREKVDAIRTGIKELEAAGYIVRARERDARGRLGGTEYVIYEQPQLIPPIWDFPTLDDPTLEKPTLENPMQLNKDIINKDKVSTESNPTYQSPALGNDESADQQKLDRVIFYEQKIKKNIEYEMLSNDQSIDKRRLEEIVTLMLETVCSTRSTFKIASDVYAAAHVKKKLLNLNCQHIQYVFECMDNNKNEIRNIRQYLLAVLFNASSTMGSYYAARVNFDSAKQKDVFSCRGDP